MTVNKENLEHPAQRGIKSTLLGIIINLFLSIIKAIAGVLGNSYALIADAIESLSDVATSFIVWAGLKISLKEPDQNHPYGHGKAEPMAAMFVSFALVIAAIIIIFQSVQNILTPHDVPKPFTLIVLVLVIIIKEVLFKKVIQVGEETGSHAVRSDAWHHRSDAITSAGTFLGIGIAIIGGKGYESADEWAAILTSGFILFNAVKVGKPAIEEIMDVAAPEELVNRFRTIAAKVQGVKAIDKCLVRKMGFDYYIDIHVVVDGEISVKEGHEIAHKVKETLTEYNRMVRGVIVHIEPFDPEFEKKKTFL
jgi:cation diffusion facilitator family transporter